MIDRRMRAWAVAGVIAIAAAIAGCGGSSSDNSSSCLLSHAERRRVGLRRGVQHHLERIDRIHHQQPGHQRRLGKRRRIRLLIAPARVTLAVAAALLALTGCGGGSSSSDSASARHSVEAYLSRVEPIRLGVNRLLERRRPDPHRLPRPPDLSRPAPARA